MCKTSLSSAVILGSFLKTGAKEELAAVRTDISRLSGTEKSVSPFSMLRVACMPL